MSSWRPDPLGLQTGLALLAAVCLMVGLCMALCHRPPQASRPRGHPGILSSPEASSRDGRFTPEKVGSLCPGTIEAEDRYQESLDVAMRSKGETR